MFKPVMDILPESQKAIWPFLKVFTDMGFVLYGGTAIALRLGHRVSVDFDFFTHRNLDKKNILVQLESLQNYRVVQDDLETLTILVLNAGISNQPVKVSFFGNLDFGRIGEPDKTADGVLQVASEDDLMATKLKVILQRVESKDYIDLAELIQNGSSLSIGLAGAAALYGANFQPSECLKALVYFKGGDLDILKEEIRNRLIAEVSKVRDLPMINKVSSNLSL